MLTRDDSFTIISLVLSVLGLAMGIATILFSFSGYSQASVNTTGIDAQVRAQRTLLAASLATVATPAAENLGAPGPAAASADAIRRALHSLQQYKLPEDA